MIARAAHAARAAYGALAARHRLRRVRRPATRLALVRTVRPRGRSTASRAPTIVATRLQLVVAPTFALSSTIAARADGPAAPASASGRGRFAAPATGMRHVERLVERVERLTERREGMPRPAGPDPIRPSAPAPAAPPRRGPALGNDLVLARPRATAPNDVPVAPAGPSAGVATPPVAERPPAADLARLTDHVLASLDRRIVAERERRGRV